MVQSEWNMALDTLYRISAGIHKCNDSMLAGNFLEWLKGIYLFYGELSTWMKVEDQKQILQDISRLKQWKSHSFESNMDEFFLTTQRLRREADKHKLLLKTEEDTSKHGG